LLKTSNEPALQPSIPTIPMTTTQKRLFTSKEIVVDIKKAKEIFDRNIDLLYISKNQTQLVFEASITDRESRSPKAKAKSEILLEKTPRKRLEDAKKAIVDRRSDFRAKLLNTLRDCIPESQITNK